MATTAQCSFRLGGNENILINATGAGNPWPSAGDRQNSGETARYTFRITNAGSGQFTLSATGENITDSSGPYIFNCTTLNPTDSDFFLTSDAFSHFAIGGDNLLDGEGFTISDVTVTSIPEPSSILLLSLGLTGVMAFRRSR